MRIGSSHYDAELQMFVEQPQEVDLARLQFVRWLVERGRLEHGVMGEPAGEYARFTRRSKRALAA